MAAELLRLIEHYFLHQKSADQICTPRFTDCANLQPVCMGFTDNFGFFLDAIAKAKKLIYKSIAQNLKQDSLTKGLFRFSNGS